MYLVYNMNIFKISFTSCVPTPENVFHVLVYMHKSA